MDAEPLRLLAVEDDPADSAWLVQLLEQSTVCPYHLSFVLTMADAEVSLEVGEVDCVLLDLSLPDSWGLESIRRILTKAPAVPVVVITGANDQEQGLSAIELGAHDYLEKGKVSGDGILRAARWATARARVIAERAGNGGGGGGLSEVRAPWARLGSDLVVATASPALLDLVGRPESAVVGGPFSALVDAADDEPVRELLSNVIEGHQVGGVVRATLPGAGEGATRLLAVAPYGDGLAVVVLEPS